jgi:hypothetical protein
LYGASRREVCRKVGPVGVTSAPVRDQAFTPSIFGPNLGTPSPQNYFVVDATEQSRPLSDRRVENYPAKEAGYASGSAQIENVEFRSRSDGVRGVAATRSKPSSLSSSSPAIDALRRLEPQPAISARTPETVFLVSEPKAKRQFADRGGLSPNSLESLLRLFPAEKYSLHHSQRPKKL